MKNMKASELKSLVGTHLVQIAKTGVIGKMQVAGEKAIINFEGGESKVISLDSVRRNYLIGEQVTDEQFGADLQIEKTSSEIEAQLIAEEEIFGQELAKASEEAEAKKDENKLEIPAEVVHKAGNFIVRKITLDGNVLFEIINAKHDELVATKNDEAKAIKLADLNAKEEAEAKAQAKEDKKAQASDKEVKAPKEVKSRQIKNEDTLKFLAQAHKVAIEKGLLKEGSAAPTTKHLIRAGSGKSKTVIKVALSRGIVEVAIYFRGDKAKENFASMEKHSAEINKALEGYSVEYKNDADKVHASITVKFNMTKEFDAKVNQSIDLALQMKELVTQYHQ